MLRAAQEAVGNRPGRARATEPRDEASPGQCERGGRRTPGDPPPDPRGPACPRRLIGPRSLMGAPPGHPDQLQLQATMRRREMR